MSAVYSVKFCLYPCLASHEWDTAGLFMNNWRPFRCSLHQAKRGYIFGVRMHYLANLAEPLQEKCICDMFQVNCHLHCYAVLRLARHELDPNTWYTRGNRCHNDCGKGIGNRLSVMNTRGNLCRHNFPYCIHEAIVEATGCRNGGDNRITDCQLNNFPADCRNDCQFWIHAATVRCHNGAQNQTCLIRAIVVATGCRNRLPRVYTI
jgi:hypothetical protein